jgi:hypothetical protein
MSLLPRPAQPLLPSCAGAFTRPTFKRFLPLRLGAVLTTGRRTLTNLVHAVGGLAPGHPSSSHRVFSRRRWSTWSLGPTLANFLLRRWVTQDSVPLAGVDPVDEHRGTKVDGKGRHRDPVRSTKTYTASRGGQKGVVLAILVRFPFAPRPWALPVLVALYRSPEWDRAHSRRPKTPARLLRQLTAVLLRWFPHRPFTPGPPHQDSESSWIGRVRPRTPGRPTEITRPAFEGSPPCPAASPPPSKTTSTTSRTRASSGPESIP